VIPVARKLSMPSLVAILLQKRACQRPALAAAEVRQRAGALHHRR
jgi:hypothetical protein